MKIGTVPYYNCLPLTANLGAQIVALPPRELTKALLNDEIDVGLIPTYSILKHNLHAFPEAGLIGCDGAVKSVGFFIRDAFKDLDDIETIYFDTESQTSVELAKIILHKLYGRNLRSIKAVPIEDICRADALLLIGDKALFFQEPGYKFWDLGALWKQLTGVGFIFAAWASKRLLKPDEFQMLLQSKQHGLSNRDQLLNGVPAQKQGLLSKYLHDAIVYDDTPELKRGYELFHDYLNEMSLLHPAPISTDLDFEAMLRWSA